MMQQLQLQNLCLTQQMDQNEMEEQTETSLRTTGAGSRGTLLRRRPRIGSAREGDAGLSVQEHVPREEEDGTAGMSVADGESKHGGGRNR